MEPVHAWLPKLVNSMLRFAKYGSEISSSPNDSDTRAGDFASEAMTGVAIAKSGFTRPAPVRVSGYAAPFSSRVCTAVFIIAALRMDGVQSGCRSISNAAAPATCGAAIEVPLTPEAVGGRGEVRLWTARAASGFPVVVIEADSAAALAAVSPKLPHYGAKSYLLFDQGELITSGIWPPDAKPLRVEFP